MPLFKRPVETIVKSGGTPATGDITLIENGNLTISQNAGSFSFSAGGGAGGGIVIAASNTTYASGTVTVTGVGGGVTVSSNTGQRIDISVAAPVAQSAQTQNNVAGIAASNTTYTSGTVSFTGVGGGITVSSNTGQRVDLSVAAPVAQTVQTQNLIDMTLAGNTSGALALMSSGTVTLAGGNNITLSQAGNAVTISAASQSVQTQPIVPNLAVWHNAAQTLGSTGTSNGTFWIFPLDPDDAVFPANMTASTAYIAVMEDQLRFDLDEIARRIGHLKEVLPYLLVKKEQAEVGISFQSRKFTRTGRKLRSREAIAADLSDWTIISALKRVPDPALKVRK